MPLGWVLRIYNGAQLLVDSVVVFGVEDVDLLAFPSDCFLMCPYRLSL